MCVHLHHLKKFSNVLNIRLSADTSEAGVAGTTFLLEAERGSACVCVGEMMRRLFDN